MGSSSNRDGEQVTRVLVVDDDKSIREVISFALSDEGYQVEEANNGHAAFESIGRLHPHIILVDMRMPGMDGWEFVRGYRERYGRRAQIIVLTAAQDAAPRMAAIDADGYVAKPFDLDVLIAQVAKSATRMSGANDL